MKQKIFGKSWYNQSRNEHSCSYMTTAIDKDKVNLKIGLDSLYAATSLFPKYFAMILFFLQEKLKRLDYDESLRVRQLKAK